MNERFLENYVFLCVYCATGEGITQYLRYKHYQEDKFDLVETVPEYYIQGGDFIKVKDLLKDESNMAIVANLCPTFANILREKKDMPANLVVDVSIHQNYS